MCRLYKKGEYESFRLQSGLVLINRPQGMTRRARLDAENEPRPFQRSLRIMPTRRESSPLLLLFRLFVHKGGFLSYKLGEYVSRSVVTRHVLEDVEKEDWDDKPKDRKSVEIEVSLE